MSARSFRSVFMVASCAGAALGCYLVSLRVASERAALENVETQIVLAQRDIRLLQTEIGTRGRLAQLERWNVQVLALSAPSADQFLEGGFALARMVTPQEKVDLEAPVVLAAAPADGPRPQIEGMEQRPERDGDEAGSPRQLLHVASLKRETLKRDMSPGAQKPVTVPHPSKPVAEATAKKEPPKPVAAAKAPSSKGKAAANASPEKAAEKPVTKSKAAAAKTKPKPSSERKAAAPDPLAPVGSAAKPEKIAATTSKDAGQKQ